MDEIFFFMYHLHMPPDKSMSLPVYERKWLINKFVEQKEKENEAIENSNKKRKK